MKGTTPASPGDVKPGTRVMLSIVEKDGMKSVTEVLMPAEKGKKD